MQKWLVGFALNNDALRSELYSICYITKATSGDQRNLGWMWNVAFHASQIIQETEYLNNRKHLKYGSETSQHFIFRLTSEIYQCFRM